MSLSSCSYRPDQTRHALSRPSVVSPLSRTLFTFKTPIFKIFMAATTNPLMLRSPSPPPYAPPVDPEIRSSLSPAARRLFCSALPSSFLSPRTLRSFKLFIPFLEPSSTFSPMLYHYPLFRFSLSPLSGLLFYSLSMHMFHTPSTPLDRLFLLRHYLYHAPFAHPLLHLPWFSFRFSLASLVDCALRGSRPRCALDLCIFALSSLTS